MFSTKLGCGNLTDRWEEFLRNSDVLGQHEHTVQNSLMASVALSILERPVKCLCSPWNNGHGIERLRVGSRGVANLAECQ